MECRFGPLGTCRLHVNRDGFVVFYLKSNFRVFDGEEAKRVADWVGVLNF